MIASTLFKCQTMKSHRNRRRLSLVPDTSVVSLCTVQADVLNLKQYTFLNWKVMRAVKVNNNSNNYTTLILLIICYPVFHTL